MSGNPPNREELQTWVLHYGFASHNSVRVNTSVQDIRSVYLGGTITRSDWRRSLVSGLGPVGVVPAAARSHILWPILPGAVVGRFDYVGPYSVSGDPEDDEWNNDEDNLEDAGSEWVVTGALVGPQRGPRVSRDPSNHAYAGGQTQPCLTQEMAVQEVWWPLARSARQVKRLTLEAFRLTDLYFAWVDTPLCAATLTEVGWASAQHKTIWIAGPQAFDELWLMYTMASRYSFHHDTAASAFQNMLQF
jgi:hypothetical protein